MKSENQDVPVGTLFERELRGYHRAQVDDYVTWLQEQCRTAQADAEALRARLAEAEAEIDRLREAR